MISASFGGMPKNAGSNISTSRRTPRAGTYPESPTRAEGRLGSSSSGPKKLMDSTPSQRFCHSSATFAAPGKRPPIPTMATSSRPTPSGAARRAGRGVIPGPLRPRPSTSSARPFTVGCWKKRTTGTSVPRASRTRARSRRASSEFPPSSKKLSRTPIPPTPTVSSKSGRICFSAGRRAATNSTSRSGRSAGGAGSCRLSTLPLALIGRLSSHTKAEGTMNSGSLGERKSRSSPSRTVPSGSPGTR